MVIGVEMAPPPHPPPKNFSPTSRQPRAMKLGIQDQLNLLIKVGHEKYGRLTPNPNVSLLR